MRDPLTKNSAHAEAMRVKGIHTVELDVTDSQSVDQAVDIVVANAGRIDVLINNAGVAAAGVSEAFTPEQVTALFDVNVIGLHRVTRKVLPILRSQNDGLIINIGTILGRVTFPFFGIYGASKFAVEALTDSLRYEVSQLGVDVALVQPSAYPTQMYSSAAQPADVGRVAEYGAIFSNVQPPRCNTSQFNNFLFQTTFYGDSHVKNDPNHRRVHRLRPRYRRNARASRSQCVRLHARSTNQEQCACQSAARQRYSHG